MMRFTPLLALLIALPAAAQDSGQHNRKVEIWECSAFMGQNKTTILTLIRNDNGTGEVHAGGTITHTDFKMQGLDRRWNWGDNPQRPGRYLYSIVLNLERTAKYYDFSMADDDGIATPKDIFKCEML